MKIENLIGFSLTALLSYLSPIRDVMDGLVVLFIINLIAGMLSGLIVQREGFVFKKAFVCIIEIAVFSVLFSAMFFIGDHRGMADKSLQAISTISYAAIYFYAVNILKNAKRLSPFGSPMYRFFSFLYYVVSIEFIKSIPYFEAYLKSVENEKAN